MLKIIKKNMRGILIATIAIIIPAFIFFYGAGRYRGGGGSGKNNPVIGNVNREKIFRQDFDYTYERMKEEQKAAYNGVWNENMEAQVKKSAFEEIVSGKLLRQEAKRRHIKISDEDVFNEIQSYRFFQQDGKFSRDLYRKVLKGSRISAGKFEEGVRNDLRIRYLINRAVDNINTSEEELKEEYIKLNEKVKVKLLIFKGADFKKETTVNDEELEEYFSNHQQEFKVPEKVNAEYMLVRFNPEAVTITEEEISDYYQKNISRYLKESGEKTDKNEDSSPIETIPLEEVSEDISKALAKQKAEDRAREETENLTYDIIDKNSWEAAELPVQETGFFARGETIKDIGWAPDFIEEAFSLETGQVSRIIQTSRGYAIFMVKDRRDTYLPQLEEAKDKVRERVIDRKAGELAKAKANEGLEVIKGGSTFEDTAAKFSLELNDCAPFSRTGYIEGIGFSAPLAESAFALQVGEVSEVLELSQGFAILKVEERQGIDEEMFSSEVDKFREQLLAWKKRQAYSQWYQELRQAANIWIDPKFQEQEGI